MRVPAEYFEALYARDPDPWRFDERWYERRKHALTVASLPQRSYSRGLEPGCSTGRLTSLLAPRCQQLVAVDAVAEAVAAARARLAGVATVDLQCRVVPDQWPSGRFDLVVLSELLYYFSGPDLDALVQRAVGCLRARGTLLAVHWRHPVNGYAISGDEAHRSLAARSDLWRLARHLEDDFVLEVYLRAASGRSVAESEGLVPAGRGDGR